jgi:molecular chaperone GrpE
MPKKEINLKEKEIDLNTTEPLEIGAGDPSERAAPGASPEAAEAARGEAPAGSAEPVRREDFERLMAERDQLLDRLARAQAEFENARKRAEREKLEFRETVSGSIVEKFLPVLDNLQLALKSNGTVEQMRSGVDLIAKQMQEVLRQMQVVPFSAEGEAFDPRLHEALGTVDREDLPDQHVAEEVRRGYKLRERLLRPALVRVARNSKQVSE